MGGQDPQHRDRISQDVAHLETMDTVADIEDKNAHSRMDREVAEYAGAERIDIDEATDRRLKKMIDKRILVIMVVTYFMQALDKGTISFVAIMNFNKDNGLIGQQVGVVTQLGTPKSQICKLTKFTIQFPWLTTCIYIAVLICEYPTNLIIQRVPIAKYLSFNIICWGIVLMCHAACHNFAGLVVVRTLLGMFETCCQPTFVVLR